jgi:Peptidase family M23
VPRKSVSDFARDALVFLLSTATDEALILSKFIAFSLIFGATTLVSSAAGSQDNALNRIKFVLPIACEIGRTCEVQNYVDRAPGPASTDYLCGTASYNDHSGVDFRLLDMVAQRQGVNVLAAAAGRVSRVRDGVADVSVRDIDRQTIAGRECGNGVVIDHGGGISTQYCHMRNGSITVRAGTQIAAGAPVGQVGLSGNTEYPHLHFTVKQGESVVDPFAPLPKSGTSCGSGPSMWQANVDRALIYKAGVLLNAGFATGAVSMASVEAGGIERPSRASPALVAYVRTINLRAGDVQVLTLKGPDGGVLATQTAPPLTAAQAQRLLFIGKNRPPPGGWAAGRYIADYAVTRSGRTIVQRQFDLRL